MTSRIFAAVAVAGAIVVAATVAFAQDDESGLGIRLLDAPADLRDDPRAQVYIVDHVAAGTTFDRRVEVANDSDEPIEPDLYVSAAEIEDGRFAVPPRGTATNELTEWATVEPAGLELAPGASSEATVTIAVPAGADDGEYYGAVFAERPPAPGGGMVASRVGIRIYLGVGDGEAPETDFEVSTLTASRREDGTPVVEAAVTNTGGRALDMSGELELTDGPGGISAGPFDAQLGTTLGIGQSEPVLVELDPDLPNGPWKATLTMRSGEREKTVTTTITFPEPGEEPETFDAEEDTARTWSGIVATVLLVAIILALALIALRTKAPRARRKNR